MTDSNGSANASVESEVAPEPTGAAATRTSPDINRKGADGLPTAVELEQILRRLVRRVAMMIQAEKCVFLLHDGERKELVARPPALGLTNEQVRALRVPANAGVSSTAFASGEPLIVNQPDTSNPVDQPWLQRLEVRNLIAYPLIIERRDEQAHTTDQTTVGVLNVINKRGGAQFEPDDLRLLSIMARQVAAVIANAQIYLRLSEEREHLQATLQSLLTGVVMVESSGHISLVNAAASQIFGVPQEKAVGRLYKDVIRNRAVSDMFKAAVEESQEDQQEIEFEIAGGSEPRIFQVQTTFVRREEDGVSAIMGVVAIFNDITEIRNVERMKTAFVSTVSHELRTPLTSIKGFIATLLQDTEDYYDKETRTEFYEIIDSECDRLRRLIEDLLDVSRIESGKALQMRWSEFDPKPIMEKVMQAQRSYTDRHRLVVNAGDDVPHIMGDPDKFDQILTNLVSNAIKYSPDGGEVKIDASCDGKLLTIRVSDQGIGIPADKIAKVFDKFERVDNRDTRRVGGTGIGLYLVKHLVERHEGRVWAESEPAKGSTFIVQIPVRPSDSTLNS